MRGRRRRGAQGGSGVRSSAHGGCRSSADRGAARGSSRAVLGRSPSAADPSGDARRGGRAAPSELRSAPCVAARCPVGGPRFLPRWVVCRRRAASAGSAPRWVAVAALGSAAGALRAGLVRLPAAPLAQRQRRAAAVAGGAAAAAPRGAARRSGARSPGASGGACSCCCQPPHCRYATAAPEDASGCSRSRYAAPLRRSCSRMRRSPTPSLTSHTTDPLSCSDLREPL